MGVYDQLSQLDKKLPPLKAPETPEEPKELHEPNTVKSLPQSSTPKKPNKHKSAAPKRKQTNKLENKQSSKQTNKSTSKHVYMQTFLAEKASDTVTFRLPPPLMEKFEEVQSLITIEHKKRLKRYEVVVAALAFLFWDFEQNGEKSELYQRLIQNGR